MKALPPRLVVGGLRVLAVLAVILAGLWFWIGLSYDDEQPRVQANEGLDAVRDAMALMQATYHDKRRLPTGNELGAVSFRPEPHVRAVRLDSDGSFMVVYQGRSEIDGKRLRLTPYLDMSGDVRWRCALPEVDPRWWPDYCRQGSKP